MSPLTTTITITITITIITITLLLTITTATITTTPTAYDLIQSYGFPKGILPIGVTGYTLDNTTGKFEAYFTNDCAFSLEGTYDLKYKKTISGTISKDRLKDLSGVSVKVWLFWLNIVEVYVDNGELGFSVGIASASFPLGNFDECPQCGCGMDCGERNGLVESS